MSGWLSPRRPTLAEIQLHQILLAHAAAAPGCAARRALHATAVSATACTAPCVAFALNLYMLGQRDRLHRAAAVSFPIPPTGNPTLIAVRRRLLRMCMCMCMCARPRRTGVPYAHSAEPRAHRQQALPRHQGPAAPGRLAHEGARSKATMSSKLRLARAGLRHGTRHARMLAARARAPRAAYGLEAAEHRRVRRSAAPRASTSSLIPSRFESERRSDGGGADEEAPTAMTGAPPSPPPPPPPRLVRRRDSEGRLAQGRRPPGPR